MCDNSVPDKFNNLIFNFSYDVIILYSKLQILCKRINEKLIKNTNYEEKIRNTLYKVLNIPEKPTNTYTFEYIKNGDVINKTVSLNKNLINEDTYDFIVLSNESTKHKKIIQKEDVNSLNDNMGVDVDSIDMIPSSVKFIVLQLSIPYLKKDDETLIDFHFSTLDYNFLIDGNRINKKFLLYFMNEYYSREIKNIEHLDGCEIRFIDGSVNMNNVNLDKDYIHIYENSYEIKNIDTLDIKNNFIESDSEYELTNEYVSPTPTSTENSNESSLESSVESSSDE